MWVILELILVLAIVLVAITEFFYPLLAGKPLFGSFRKTTAKTEEKKSSDGPLEEKVYVAKEKVADVKEEVKTVQDEVTKHFKTAEELKREADDLLK